MFSWIYAIYAYALNVNPDVGTIYGGLYSLGCQLPCVSSFKKLACLLHVDTTLAILHLSMLYLLNGEIE